MPLPRRPPSLVLAPARPGWLTAGMLRLATLSLFVVAIGMIRWHLTTATAWIVVGVGAAIALLGLAALLGATRRVEQRLAIPWATQAFVLVLRRTHPDLPRAFRCPGVPVVPILAVASCLFLMLNLRPVTWAAFGIWLVIGLVIYFLYSRHHSKLAHGHHDAH